MIKDHSEREETCCCHYTGYSFQLAARVLCYAHPTDRIPQPLLHSFVEHWLELDKWMEGRKEGNVLFNDALNTLYFTVIWRQTYGKGPFR